MHNQEQHNQYFLQKQNDTVINKISKFLDSRNLSIFQFWQSEQNCASATDIIKFCKSCGLQLPQYDIINLKSQIFADRQMIYVDKFAQMIPFWNQQGKNAIGQFMKKRSDILLQKIQSKDKQRARSSQTYKNQRPSSSFTRVGSALSREKLSNEKIASPKIFIRNNSMQNLRSYKLKQQKRQKQLNDNIQKNRISQQYGMLLKMSELNSINKDRQNPITYRAIKNAESIIKVRVFNLNKCEKEISLKEFDTIYKNCKKNMKQNKQWNVVTPATTKQIDQLQLLKSKNVQKSQRQQQLKNLLVNTVNLTNLLKQQIKIFKMKGIYGCQNL